MAIEYMYDLIQGSEEWHAARLGLLTASQMKNIITATTLKPVAGIEKGTSAFLLDIVAQRAAQWTEESYSSWDMQRGQVEEVYAKDLYIKHRAPVKDCGFITNDHWGFKIGFSADGLVGETGFIEAKSRNQKYQTQTIIDGVVPAEYMMQIQSGFLVTEREWCDFISYSNGLPMFIRRVTPDENTMAAIEEAAFVFEKKAKELLEIYKDKCAGLIVAPRRDPEDGTEIKPSHDKENPTDYYMAG